MNTNVVHILSSDDDEVLPSSNNNQVDDRVPNEKQMVHEQLLL